MANMVFTAARQGFATAEVDLDTATVKVAIVRGYTPNAAHVFVADVLAAGGVFNGTPATLASKSVSGSGVFDAADTSIETSASAVNHGVLMFQASAPAGGADVATSAQRLIAWWDTGGGLPVQPGAGTSPIVWPDTAGRILSINAA